MATQARVSQPPPSLTFQGIVVPGSSLNPKAFFAGTRRQTVLQKTISSWAGFGATDVVDTLRAGILGSYTIKISGSLVITLNSGSAASTAKWPYGLLRAVRFQANGQSNLVNADGWFLRAREFIASALNDRGVQNNIGSSTAYQGTMALNSESWGVASAKSSLSGGTYDVELTFKVPVAYENKMLVGAIFCQTMSTTLELDLDWANLSDLFTLAGGATATFSPSVTVEAEMFTIPSDGKGGMYLPNLSAFHSYIESRAPNAIANGNNEIVLAGQGVGRQLMRFLWRTQNGSTPAPLALNATNMTSPYWRYGTNTTPETWLDGQDVRYQNERDYNVDLGEYAGLAVVDFDRTWGFRDSIDEGSATELRFGYTIPSGVSLTSPVCEYAQDVILAGAAA